MTEYLIINVLTSLWAWSMQRFVLTDARHQFAALMFALLCWLLPFGWFQYQADVTVLTVTQPMVSQIKQPMVNLANSTSFDLSWLQILTIVMTLGLLRFIFDLKQMHQQHQSFKATGQATELTGVFTIKGLNNACVTGFKPSLIWIDEALFHSESRPAILTHEQQHIKNKDPYWLLLIILMQRVFWFNPLVWLLTQNLQSCIERRCDQDCKQTMNQGEYQSQLAKTLLLMNSQTSKLSNYMSQNPNNIQRIQHLTKEHTMRIKQKFVLTLTTLITMAASFTVLADNVRPLIGENHILLDVKYSIDGSEVKTLSLLIEDGKEASIKINEQMIVFNPQIIQPQFKEIETDKVAIAEHALIPQIITSFEFSDGDKNTDSSRGTIISLDKQWAGINIGQSHQKNIISLELKATVADS